MAIYIKSTLLLQHFSITGITNLSKDLSLDWTSFEKSIDMRNIKFNQGFHPSCRHLETLRLSPLWKLVLLNIVQKHNKIVFMHFKRGHRRHSHQTTPQAWGPLKVPLTRPWPLKLKGLAKIYPSPNWPAASIFSKHYIGIVHILRNQFLAFFTPLPPP